ncbi:ATP-binding cassette [Cordyceps militaris]|uniref:ATP-binding cassette n=1 Tax=Cordyceps militaris TaxID=73501 RepID=A0A2H4SGR6_CORMI|nr:ATP-binding cassette [Cordyceps militaris]
MDQRSLESLLLRLIYDSAFNSRKPAGSQIAAIGYNSAQFCTQIPPTHFISPKHGHTPGNGAVVLSSRISPESVCQHEMIDVPVQGWPRPGIGAQLTPRDMVDKLCKHLSLCPGVLEASHYALDETLTFLALNNICQRRHSKNGNNVDVFHVVDVTCCVQAYGIPARRLLKQGTGVDLYLCPGIGHGHDHPLSCLPLTPEDLQLGIHELQLNTQLNTIGCRLHADEPNHMSMRCCVSVVPALLAMIQCMYLLHHVSILATVIISRALVYKSINAKRSATVLVALRSLDENSQDTSRIVLSWIEDACSVRPSLILSLYLVVTLLLDLPKAPTLWLRGCDAAVIIYTAAVVFNTLFRPVENTGNRTLLLSVHQTLPPKATSGQVDRSRYALAIEDLYTLDDALLRPARRLEFPIAVSRAVLYDFLAIAPPRVSLIGFIFAPNPDRLLPSYLRQGSVESRRRFCDCHTYEHRRRLNRRSPWLPGTTIKKAICGQFQVDSLTDTNLYDEVLDVAVLKHDLAQLHKGDNTKMGSSGGGGILSGGQKQRVFLARALYSCPKTLLLDDFHIVQKRSGLEAWLTTISAKLATSVDWSKTGPTVDFPRAGAFQDVPEAAEDDDESKEEAKDAELPCREKWRIKRKGRFASASWTWTSISNGWFKSWTFVGFTVVHVFAATFASSANGASPLVELVHQWTWHVGNALCLSYTCYPGYSMLSTSPVMRGIMHPTGMHESQLGKTRPMLTQISHPHLSTLNHFSQNMSLVETQIATRTLVTVTSRSQKNLGKKKPPQVYAEESTVDSLLGAAAEAPLTATGSPYMAATVPLLIAAMYVLENFHFQTSQQLRVLRLKAQALLHCKTYGQALLARWQRPKYLFMCVQTWLSTVLMLDLLVAAEATTVVLLALLLRSCTNPALLGVSLNNILCKCLPETLGKSATADDLLMQVWRPVIVAAGRCWRSRWVPLRELRSFEQDVKPENRPKEVCASHRRHGRFEGGIREMRGVGRVTQVSTPLHRFQKSHVSANWRAALARSQDWRLRTAPEGQSASICFHASDKSSGLVATLTQLLEMEEEFIKIVGYNLGNPPTRPVAQDARPRADRHTVDAGGQHGDAAVEAVLRRVGLWNGLESGGLDMELTTASLCGAAGRAVDGATDGWCYGWCCVTCLQVHRGAGRLMTSTPSAPGSTYPSVRLRRGQGGRRPVGGGGCARGAGAEAGWAFCVIGA